LTTAHSVELATSSTKGNDYALLATIKNEPSEELENRHSRNQIVNGSKPVESNSTTIKNNGTKSITKKTKKL
jgi:thiamine monophosphate kinase